LTPLDDWLLDALHLTSAAQHRVFFWYKRWQVVRCAVSLGQLRPACPAGFDFRRLRVASAFWGQLE
jgi:hypothetical protein